MNGSWYYYIYNAHGDVVGLVNEAGTVVNTYEYTPWGEVRNETEMVDNPIKYAGEYYDDELGMIYLRARYYDPQIGRFTSLDVEEGNIAIPLEMNRYVYCLNNPIKYVDPYGEFPLAISAGAALLSKAVPYIVTGVAVIVKVVNYAKKNKQPESLPKTGKPNTSKDLLNPDGTVKQRRFYGPDGKAEKDIDYNHGNGDGTHTFPHTHKWDWSSGSGVRK